MTKISLIASTFVLLTGNSIALPEDPQCRTSCYEAAHECSQHSANPLTSHQCGKENFACHMSCQGTHKMEHYNERGSMQYSFRPILEDLF